MTDVRALFSNKVEDYARARPAYPPEVFAFLKRFYPERSCVADVGAGTGIFSAQLAAAGFAVQAVEPNEEMRARIPVPISSGGGSAEATGLADHSVDFVTCAQAFHWFRPHEAKLEFRRIVKPGGKTFVVYNDRAGLHEPGLARDLDEIFEMFRKRVKRPNQADDHVFSAFFDQGFSKEQFKITTELTGAQLEALMFSRSYMPEACDPQSAAVKARIQALFARYQTQGRVTLPYETTVTFGVLG